MKKVILVLIATLSFNAHAIQFENPETKQLTMKFVKQVGDRWDLGTAEGGGLLIYGDEYQILTNKGFSMRKVTATYAEIERLKQYSHAASETCPVTITFDRDTGVISKAKLQCDPLALLGLQNKEG